MKRQKILAILVVLITLFAVSPTMPAEAVGFVLSVGDLRPVLLAPTDEIQTVTPKLQWKMEWRKESNPQPSPAPNHRMEFRVIVFHNDSPIWEPTRPIPAVSGKTEYEVQVPSGVLVPGKSFSWQVIGQTYTGDQQGAQRVSTKQVFTVRAGCSVRLQSISNKLVHGTAMLPGVRISAFSLQTPNLMLAQAVTDKQGQANLTFPVCPVSPAQAESASMQGAVTWRAERAGFRNVAVSYQSNSKLLLYVMTPTN